LGEEKVGFRNTSIFDKAGSQKDGKSDSEESASASPLCAQCGSQMLYRDGLRYLADGSSVQRWLCRDCAYRFSEKPPQKNLTLTINTANTLTFKRRICASRKEAKNLTTATETKTVAGEEQATKGKILQFALHCKNEGLAEETVRIWYNRLKKISENAELNEPESVKAYIAKAAFAQGTKYNMVVIYNAYLQFIGKTWKRPKYHIEEKLP